MTQYNSLNVKLSNLELNKSKSGIKNGTEVIFDLPPYVISISKTNSFRKSL